MVMQELAKLRALRKASPSRVVPDLALGDELPERTQAVESSAPRIAGDDRRIDGTDRHAGHPVWLDVGLVQGLIDAGLIGPEGAAALQHQRDPLAAVGTPSALVLSPLTLTVAKFVGGRVHGTRAPTAGEPSRRGMTRS
jgi:hypothetical protein